MAYTRKMQQIAEANDVHLKAEEETLPDGESPVKKFGNQELLSTDPSIAFVVGDESLADF